MKELIFEYFNIKFCFSPCIHVHVHNYSHVQYVLYTYMYKLTPNYWLFSRQNFILQCIQLVVKFVVLVEE